MIKNDDDRPACEQPAWAIAFEVAVGVAAIVYMIVALLFMAAGAS
jgi:hypothetical protein